MESPPACAIPASSRVRGSRFAVREFASSLFAWGPGPTNSEQRTANSEPRTANSEPRTANREQRIANSELLDHYIPFEPVGFFLPDVLADFLVELRPRFPRAVLLELADHSRASAGNTQDV